MTVSKAIVASPVGLLLLEAGPEGMRHLRYLSATYPLAQDRPCYCASSHHLDQALYELKEYFEGQRQRFSVALSPVGTDFQSRVWSALSEIPYGHVLSYRHHAETIGHPRAVRATGRAIGKNPLPILIPCHRIIRGDGSLGGYLGGPHRKLSLLQIEGWPNGGTADLFSFS